MSQEAPGTRADETRVDRCVRRLRANDPNLTSLRLADFLGGGLTAQYDDGESTSKIATALEGNTKVRYLNMRHFPVSETPATQSIARAIQLNKSIVSLRLRVQDLLDSGAVQNFCEALGRREDDFDVLLEFAASIEPFRLMAREFLESAKGLKKLSVIAQGTFDDEIGDLSPECFACCKSLRNIDLRSFSARPQSVATLSAALSSLNFIQSVGLRDVMLGNDGATTFAESFRASASLKRLRLQDCEIGDEGAKAVAKSLLPKLAGAELFLRRNFIGDEGAKALAAAVSDDRIHPLGLSLDGNMYSSAGVKAFASVLLGNGTCLQQLCLSVDTVDEFAIQELFESLKTNTELRSLTFRVPSSSVIHWYTSINEALLHNHTLVEFEHHTMCVPTEMTSEATRLRERCVQLLAWNQKGPIIAAAKKGALFPDHLIRGLPESAIPEAMARINELGGEARVRAFYSFFRKVDLGSLASMTSKKRPL